MKMNLKPFLQSTKLWTKKNLPSILLTMGVGSMLTAAILAVKATPKAKEALDNKKDELHADKLKAIDVVKTAGRYYIPAAGCFAAGAVCVFAGGNEYSKRLGNAVMLASVAETALQDYKDKTLEVVGPKKTDEIEAKVAEKDVERHPIPEYSSIPHLQGGNTLCYDPYSGRYFYHDPEKIKQALTRLSMRMRNGTDRSISLNDYYSEIGLSNVELGDCLGWYEDQRSLVAGEIAPNFKYLSIENGPPLWVLRFLTSPEQGFDSEKLR